MGNLGKEPFKVDANLVVTGRTCVLGASGSGKVVPPKLNEADVRDVVKGLWEGADLESFEPFVYPFYRVELTRKRRHRQVWLDGRTGKQLPA